MAHDILTVLPSFEGCGTTKDGVAIIIVIGDVVEIKSGTDEMSGSTLEDCGMGSVLMAEISGCLSDDENSDGELRGEVEMEVAIDSSEDVKIEVVAIDIRVDDGVREVRTEAAIDGSEDVLVEIGSTEIKAEDDVREISVEAAIDCSEDVHKEPVAVDTRGEVDVRKVRREVGGPIPPRTGGKDTVIVLVCVIIDMTEVFAMESNTPELAHAEYEAKSPRNVTGTLPIKSITVPKAYALSNGRTTAVENCDITARTAVQLIPIDSEITVETT